MMTTFFIKTYGCQMNKSDSERIAGVLTACGLFETQDIDKASIVVFNTCFVRKNAENKFFGHLAAYKYANGHTKTVIVAGCIGQKYKKQLFKKGADIVVGPQSIDKLPQLIASKNGSSFRDSTEVFTVDLPEIRQSPFQAWLPVITGCNNFCSYCGVPDVRGREKSLAFEKVLDEARRAAGGGVVELTLLGQNVNSYGRDLYGEPRFAELVETLASINGIKRIRFATSHPKDLSDDLIRVIEGNEKVCKFIQLPVQAGSTKILKKMNRGYTKEKYLKLVSKIRKAIPDIAIGTDIMVGFPGESEKDFQETIEVVKKAAFESAFTFIYSPRPGTKSFEEKKNDPKINSERFSLLSDLINLQFNDAHQRLLDKELEILVESDSKKYPDILTGRTDCNKLVHFASNNHRPGDFVKVKINKAFSWHLEGEVI